MSCIYSTQRCGLLCLALLKHPAGVAGAWLLQRQPQRWFLCRGRVTDTPLFTPRSCPPSCQRVSLINVISQREEKQNTCDHLMWLPICGLPPSNAWVRRAGFSFVWWSSLMLCHIPSLPSSTGLGLCYHRKAAWDGGPTLCSWSMKAGT